MGYQFCPYCAAALKPGSEGFPVCPRGHFVDYPNVTAAAGLIPVRGHEVLLARRGIEPFKDTYDIIGGFMTPGETAEAAALREGAEETGTHFKIIAPLGTYASTYRSHGHEKPIINLIYLAEITIGQPVAHDDVSALEWHSIERLPAEIGVNGFNYLEQVMQDLQQWHRSR